MDDDQVLWVDEMPDAYDAGLGPTVFQPFADDLAGRVAARGPSSVLELAAGTGVLTRALLAAIPGASLVATDLNDAMVEFGARHVPGATWRQADAMLLPFDDGSFDLVVCQFGVMFLPDKRAAYSEARRVLRPGGAFLFNAWGPLADHAFESVLTDALAIAMPDDPPTFMATGPHGYPMLDQAVGDLQAAGFECDVAEAVVLEGRSASAATLARGYCRGTPLRAAIVASADLDTVTDVVTSHFESVWGLGEVRGEMLANVLEAVPRAHG